MLASPCQPDTDRPGDVHRLQRFPVWSQACLWRRRPFSTFTAGNLWLASQSLRCNEHGHAIKKFFASLRTPLHQSNWSGWCIDEHQAREICILSAMAKGPMRPARKLAVGADPDIPHVCDLAFAYCVASAFTWWHSSAIHRRRSLWVWKATIHRLNDKHCDVLIESIRRWHCSASPLINVTARNAADGASHELARSPAQLLATSHPSIGSSFGLLAS